MKAEPLLGYTASAVLRERPPNPSNPPLDWSHTRCPYATNVCHEVMPDMTAVEGGNVAFHLQTSGSGLQGWSLTDLKTPLGHSVTAEEDVPAINQPFAGDGRRDPEETT